ncbi:MAG: hypothetical protein NC307_07845 [Roseburia sp.]|nr:hypothetical protein [Roseburia sp.]
MKHLAKIAVIVVVYIFLSKSFFDFLSPASDAKTAGNQMGLDQNGNVYLARRSAWDLWVFKIGKRGEREVFRCPAWHIGTQKRSVSLTCDDNTLYVLQSWYKNEKQMIYVSKMEEPTHELKEILKREVDANVDICDFQVEKGVVYVTGIDCRTEDIFLYSNDQQEEREFRIEGKIPVTACHAKSGVTALTQDRQLYRLENQDAVKMNLKEMVFLKAGSGGIFLQKFMEKDLRYYDLKGYLIFRCTLESYVRDVQIDNRRENLAVLSNDGEEDKLLFYSKDREKVVYADDCSVSTKDICRELFWPFIKFSLIYFLCAFLFLFLMGKVQKKRKLQFQMLSALAFVSFFWMVFTFIIFWDTQRDRALSERSFHAGTCNHVQKERFLNVFEPKLFSMEEYPGSSTQTLVEEALSNDDMLGAWKQLFIHTEVFIRQEEEYYVIFSEERAFGANIACVYQKNAFERICELCEEYAKEGGIEFTLEWNGVEYVASMCPIEGRGGMYILTKFPTSDIEDEVKDIMAPVCLFGIGGWFFLFLISFLYLRIKWRAMSVVVTQMDKISKGDFHMPGKKLPDNEFGVLWASLGRMCSVMQIEDYKKKGTLNHLYQFAPKSFEEMFYKDYLYEVEVGECVEVFATVGILSLVDQDMFFEDTWEENYIFYVNRLLEGLFRQENAGKGIFFQDDSTLESLKVLFPGEEGAKEAVAFGMVCMEELTTKTRDCCWKNPFLFLHTSRYLIGLAGGKSRVYPFVASDEFAVLNPFSKELKKRGVFMAITEETMRKIPKEVQVRHIGFGASGDEIYRFQIYEILDVCPPAVKEAKIRTKVKFAQALELFYKNEYYQARSGFLEVLKECREDGIARWYVFMCEEALNGEIRHDLFFERNRET